MMQIEFCICYFEHDYLRWITLVLSSIELFSVNWLHMLNKKIRFTFPGRGGASAPLAHACGRPWQQIPGLSRKPTKAETVLAFGRSTDPAYVSTFLKFGNAENNRYLYYLAKRVIALFPLNKPLSHRVRTTSPPEEAKAFV